MSSRVAKGVLVAPLLLMLAAWTALSAAQNPLEQLIQMQREYHWRISFRPYCRSGENCRSDDRFFGSALSRSASRQGHRAPQPGEGSRRPGTLP